MLRRVLLAYKPRPPIMDYLQRAFEKRGIAVQHVNMETNHWFDRWIIHPVNKQLWNLRLLPKGKSAFEGYPLEHLEYRSSLVEKAVGDFQPDLFLIIRGWPVTTHALERIRGRCYIMGWWVEQEWRMAEAFREIHLYDHYFFVNSVCVDEGQRRGYTNISLLHHAVDPESFYPMGDASKDYDCCFVGGWSPRRQSFVERVLEVTDNVGIYGPKWRKKNIFNRRVLKAVRGDYISGGDLVRLYNATRIVLNITHWGQEGGEKSGMNMRILEAPACGAFLLTDGSRDLGNVVVPGKHVVVYEGLADFEQKLRYYLRNETARMAIAEEGCRHVICHRTYDGVVDHIVSVFTALRNGDER